MPMTCEEIKAVIDQKKEARVPILVDLSQAQASVMLAQQDLMEANEDLTNAQVALAQINAEIETWEQVYDNAGCNGHSSSSSSGGGGGGSSSSSSG